MTIRDLDDTVKDRLRVQAATNGRSMEAEARAILAAAVFAGPAAPSAPRERDPETRLRMARPATRRGGWSDLPRVVGGPSVAEILDDLRAERLDDEGAP